MAEAGTVTIAARIEQHLARLGKTPAWLAEKAGVERSTVTRILNGERNPTADTLDHIAAVFDMSLAELVAGTDAEGRVAEEERMVPRRDFEGVMRQMIHFENRANELDVRMRERDESILGLEKQIRDSKAECVAVRRQCALVERERDQARHDALRHEGDALRYREGLERAVGDVALLKGQLTEMAKKVDDSRMAGQAAALLAGLAAVVTVATYAGTDSGKAPRKRKSRSEPTS